MTSTPELVKHRFSIELRRCCGSHYKSTPSNEQFARDLYLSSKYVVKVSRETARKWFKGESFPDLDHLLHLISWLNLDMTKVFVDELLPDKSQPKASQSHSLDDESIKDMTPEQIQLFVQLFNSIKSSELGKLNKS